MWGTSTSHPFEFWTDRAVYLPAAWSAVNKCTYIMNTKQRTKCKVLMMYVCVHVLCRQINVVACLMMVVICLVGRSYNNNQCSFFVVRVFVCC